MENYLLIYVEVMKQIHVLSSECIGVEDSTFGVLSL